MTPWGEALNTPCGHCHHGVKYHIPEAEGHFRCAICHCFQRAGSVTAIGLADALARADEALALAESRECDDCHEPLDTDACRHNVDRPYCSACIGNCPECVADLKDDMAAEAAMERGR